MGQGGSDTLLSRISSQVCILLVYDITNRRSFDVIREYWKPQLDIALSDKSVHLIQPRLLLVGNKMDLGHARVVSHSEHSKLAADLKIPEFVVSAKSNDSVTYPFMYFAAETAGLDPKKAVTFLQSNVQAIIMPSAAPEPHRSSIDESSNHSQTACSIM